MRILAISGSLRGVSSNTQALRALTSLAPDGVEVSLYNGIGDLPHFNPDLDGDTPPGAVADFRAALANADGVVLSSPEYAHGVPGVLKNALDWVVGSGEFYEKPVAIINASPRAVHALASLTETLTMMGARIVPEASIAVPLLSRALPEGGIAADAEIADALRKAVADFSRAIGRD